jgi:hypothetical protein
VCPLSGTSTVQRSGRTGFPIKRGQSRKLAQIVDEQFREELAKNTHYALADQAGPGALTVRPLLLDIVRGCRPSRWAAMTCSSTRLAQRRWWWRSDPRAARRWRGPADRRWPSHRGMANFGALRSNQVTTWQEVRRLADRWGRLLGQRLEQLYFAPKPR